MYIPSETENTFQKTWNVNEYTTELKKVNGRVKTWSAHRFKTRNREQMTNGTNTKEIPCNDGKI